MQRLAVIGRDRNFLKARNLPSVLCGLVAYCSAGLSDTCTSPCQEAYDGASQQFYQQLVDEGEVTDEQKIAILQQLCSCVFESVFSHTKSHDKGLLKCTRTA